MPTLVQQHYTNNNQLITRITPYFTPSLPHLTTTDKDSVYNLGYPLRILWILLLCKLLTTYPMYVFPPKCPRFLIQLQPILPVPDSYKPTTPLVTHAKCTPQSYSSPTIHHLELKLNILYHILQQQSPKLHKIKQAKPLPLRSERQLSRLPSLPDQPSTST